MFFRRLSGWELANFDDYKNCYLRFGGNFSTHPKVLNYIHNNANCDENYYIHRTSGNIDGAVCTWGNNLANDICTIPVTSDLCIPVAKDELILPITKEKRIFIPFKGKIISPINKNIINRNEFFNSKRAICLAKPLELFSKKTIQTRNRELKSFLNNGGEIRDQSEFSAKELIDIYDFLFEKRRGQKISNKEMVINFTQHFREHFFGKILFFNAQPSAFMLVTKCESRDIISLDFINIGINKEIKKYSPGSILMWVNINEAYCTLGLNGKQIRFSFGRPTAEYKKRWCNEERLGRLL